MFTVEIKNSCSCAIKRGVSEMQSFATKQEAEEEANRLLEQMRAEFCKKHKFDLRNEYGNFKIYILANT